MRMPHIPIHWIPKVLGMLAVPTLAVAALVTATPDQQQTMQTTEVTTPRDSLPPAAHKAPPTTASGAVSTGGDETASTTTEAPGATEEATATDSATGQSPGATDEMASAIGEPGPVAKPAAVAAPATTKAPTSTTALPTTPTAGAAPIDAPPPPPPPTSPPITSPPPPQSKNCIVRLHGKGGGGSATTTNSGATEINPAGNGSGWGGRQWSYSASGEYSGALNVISGAVNSENCTRVVLIGFSNGASMAAKLYCKGETLGGRLAGVIVDDPVTDHAVDGCSPAGGVGITLYWTGALQGVAQPGWDCSIEDWTCEGGSTIGIDAYASALGAGIKSSPNAGRHSAYANPPEIRQF